jgi:hypothetical protein
MPTNKVVQFLGWFSIGLGAAEIVAPGLLGRYLGLNNRRGLLRFYGLRELGAGLGLLTGKPGVAPWLWARVAGDVLDLGTLLSADAKRAPQKRHVLGALASVLGITGLDLFESFRQSRATYGRTLRADRVTRLATYSPETPKLNVRKHRTSPTR